MERWQVEEEVDCKNSWLKRGLYEGKNISLVRFKN